MPPVLVLIGAPGSGKSAVGAAVADVLGVDFRDTDLDTEAAAGSSIPDIFIAEGEEGFRSRERAAVSAAVTDHTGVLALGGGAVLNADTRADLAGLPVVWLQVGATEAAKRAGISGPRPLLLGNVRTTWLSQLKQREPLYRELASHEVSTDGRTIEQVVQDVSMLVSQGEDQ
jgi:shikimate kinase